MSTEPKLSRTEAAVFLCDHGCHATKQSLEVAAHRGSGPTYELIGGRAAYTEKALIAHVEKVTGPPRAKAMIDSERAEEIRQKEIEYERRRKAAKAAADEAKAEAQAQAKPERTKPAQRGRARERAAA